MIGPQRRQALILFAASLFGLLLATAEITAAVIFLNQRHMLFENSVYDDAADPHQIGLSGIQVVFIGASDGLTLASWYKPAYPGCPTILFFHGNEGDVKGAAMKMEQLLHVGYGAFFLEYRLWGQSGKTVGTRTVRRRPRRHPLFKPQGLASRRAGLPRRIPWHGRCG